MSGMKISELDFMRLLPVFMRDDEAVIAFSKAMNRLLGVPGGRLSTIRTWDKIDELNEAECDELAWELDIDWYDSTSMTLEEKRETIRLAQQIKRKRGTKWAVERLISIYFGEGHVVEWYDMDGYLSDVDAARVGSAIVGGAIVGGGVDIVPYTFEVLTTSPDITNENYGRFLESVNVAKNERSHLAGIFYFWPQGPTNGVAYAPDPDTHLYRYDKCGTRHRTATVGFIVKAGGEAVPEDKAHLYGFTAAGENDCGTYPRTATVGAVVKADAAAEPATASTLYGFPECGVNGDKAILGAAIVGTAIVNKSILRS